MEPTELADRQTPNAFAQDHFRGPPRRSDLLADALSFG